METVNKKIPASFVALCVQSFFFFSCTTVSYLWSTLVFSSSSLGVCNDS